MPRSCRCCPMLPILPSNFHQKTGLEAVLKRSSPEAVDEYINLLDEYINLLDEYINLVGEYNYNKRLWVEKLSYANCTLERS